MHVVRNCCAELWDLQGLGSRFRGLVFGCRFRVLSLEGAWCQGLGLGLGTCRVSKTVWWCSDTVLTSPLVFKEGIDRYNSPYILPNDVGRSSILRTPPPETIGHLKKQKERNS